VECLAWVEWECNPKPNLKKPGSTGLFFLLKNI